MNTSCRSEENVLVVCIFVPSFEQQPTNG